MTVLLNITTVPQNFAAGTYGAAATAINSGRWRVVITPTDGSASYTGGNFHAILGQFHGGLWFNDKNLELYTTPNDDLAFSVALTWSPGQPITLDVDAGVGHMTATITGATTGNGTVGLAFPGPYIDPTLLLEIGRQGGGTAFALVGGISAIDDGVTGDVVASASIVLIGGTIGDRLGLKDAASPTNITLVGGVVSEGRGGNSDGVSPATIAIVGGSIPVKRAYADALSSAQVAIAGASVDEGPGGLVSLGQTAVDFQRFAFASRPASVSVDTPATGAVVLLCAGGKSGDVSVPWTDSKNVAAPVIVGPLVEYPDFAGYGTVVGLTPAPMTGGAAQTFTQAVTARDENTTFALVAVVAGGHPRVTEVHNNVANASGTTQQTSPTISIDGEALLIAFWWGASPVTPPFSSPAPGVGTPYTAVPDGGFTVVRSYLVNNEFGEVQAAMACLYVPAGAGASTRSVTWTHSPAQGAQLRLVAIQPAASDATTPASIALVGQAIGERLSLRDSVSPAALQVTGAAVVEGVLRMDNVSPASIVIAGESIPARRVTIDAVSAATLSLFGASVQDQVSRNQADLATPALIALSGGSITDRVDRADHVTPAALALVGTLVAVRRAVADAAASASISISGGNVPDQVIGGAHDVVSPATLIVASGLVQTRVTRSVSVVAAVMLLRGSEVQVQETSASSGSPPPVPPGRAADRLEGRVVVPSIEPRTSEDLHLFGVVRRKNDV